MADTADFDVEYCTKETYNNPPFGHPNENIDEWKNTPSADAIWMATSSMKNGSWTDWTISRVKGEKGDPGDGVTPEQVDQIEALVKQAVLESAQENLNTAVENLNSRINETNAN